MCSKTSTEDPFRECSFYLRRETEKRGHHESGERSNKKTRLMRAATYELASPFRGVAIGKSRLNAGSTPLNRKRTLGEIDVAARRSSGISAVNWYVSQASSPSPTRSPAR